MRAWLACHIAANHDLSANVCAPGEKAAATLLLHGHFAAVLHQAKPWLGLVCHPHLSLWVSFLQTSHNL